MSPPLEDISALLRDGRPIPCVLLAQASMLAADGDWLRNMVDEAGYTRYNIETDELVKPHATR